MNSVLYKAEGISNYNALQLQVRKRLSNGLQFTASYTWSHALDEQSGLGLFFTGNNPHTPRSSYGSSDFDRPNVFLINYSYTIPKVTSNKASRLRHQRLDHRRTDRGAERRTLQRLRLFGFGGKPLLRNRRRDCKPDCALEARRHRDQAKFQGTTGVNAGKPVLNISDFSPQFVAPGTNGVPPCERRVRYL